MGSDGIVSVAVGATVGYTKKCQQGNQRHVNYHGDEHKLGRGTFSRTVSLANSSK